MQVAVDERTVEAIAARVTAALREDIHALLEASTPRTGTPGSLTVEQLAARLGVARSTVYAHWREWGGYKLGLGPKAPIRFDRESLPLRASASTPSALDRSSNTSAPPRQKRDRRHLVSDAPRLVGPLEEVA